jgi:hypothetical protein
VIIPQYNLALRPPASASIDFQLALAINLPRCRRSNFRLAPVLRPSSPTSDQVPACAESFSSDRASDRPPILAMVVLSARPAANSQLASVVMLSGSTGSERRGLRRIFHPPARPGISPRLPPAFTS